MKKPLLLVMIFYFVTISSNSVFAGIQAQKESKNHYHPDGSLRVGSSMQFYPSGPVQPVAPTSNLDELWDMLFQVNINTTAGESGYYGIEWVEEEFFVTRWDEINTIVKLSGDGDYNGSITTSLNGIMEITYDGEYLYATNGTSTLYCLDSETGTSIPENDIFIPLSEDVLMSDMNLVSYDLMTDSFWAGNYQYIMNFDRSGTVLYHGVNEHGIFWVSLFPMYGIAVDNSVGGNYLYVAHVDDQSEIHIIKIDIDNDFEILDEFDAEEFGSNDGIAGGLCFTKNWDTQYKSLGILSQGNINYLTLLELDQLAEDNAPGQITNYSMVPDSNGDLVAILNWTNPSLQANGDFLTDLDEIQIFKDDILIYTDPTPEIGEASTYSDSNIDAAGIYSYTIFGVNDAGNGLSVQQTFWIGEDVPDVVDDLNLEQTDPDLLAATLTWTNPTSGLYGGAFNNPIQGYTIIRSDGEEFNLDGPQTSFTDDTLPFHDYYSYSVQPFNSTGDGGTTSSNTELLTGPGFILFEGFEEVPPEGWSTQELGQENWIQSPLSVFAGGYAPELRFFWGESDFVGMSRLCSQEINTQGIYEIQLQFNHNVNHWAEGYSVGVATSSDGTNWTTVWEIFPTWHISSTSEFVEIINDDVGSETFQICFFFNGNSYDINSWYIDNVILAGEYAPNGSPGQASNVFLTPDPDGANEANISWTCPNNDLYGNPLTELLEMRLYRDDVLIYTDDNPVMGQADTYSDNVTEPGLYAYSLMGFNSNGEGLPVNISSWIGEDVPAAVSDLILSAQNGDAYLTWTNPDEGLHGGSFNNPILGYRIQRSDGEEINLTGTATEFLDDSLPGQNNYWYTVTAYNASGNGGTATSNTVMIGVSTQIFVDNFDNGLENWVNVNNLPGANEAIWTVYGDPYPNGYSLGPGSEGNVCAVDASENGVHDCELVLAESIDMSNVLYANIEFNTDYYGRDEDDNGYVSVSIDGGETWTDVIHWTTESVYNQTFFVDITEHVALQPSVLIRFYYTQAEFGYWWAIDNVTISVIEETVNEPIIDTSLDVLNFDPTEVGSLSELPLTIYNQGSANLEILDIYTSSPESFFTNWSADNDIIVSGDSLELIVSFQPDDTLDFEETLTIDNNDQTVIINLSGEGFIDVGIENNGKGLPKVFEISSIYPNPFNPTTSITVAIPNRAQLMVTIYDILGRNVVELVKDEVNTGYHTFHFDAKDFASGMYFVHVVSPGSLNDLRKIILVK